MEIRHQRAQGDDLLLIRCRSCESFGELGAQVAGNPHPLSELGEGAINENLFSESALKMGAHFVAWF